MPDEGGVPEGALSGRCRSRLLRATWPSPRRNARRAASPRWSTTTVRARGGPTCACRRRQGTGPPGGHGAPLASGEARFAAASRCAAWPRSVSRTVRLRRRQRPVPAARDRRRPSLIVLTSDRRPRRRPASTWSARWASSAAARPSASTSRRRGLLGARCAAVTAKAAILVVGRVGSIGAVASGWPATSRRGGRCCSAPGPTSTCRRWLTRSAPTSAWSPTRPTGRARRALVPTDRTAPDFRPFLAVGRDRRSLRPAGAPAAPRRRLAGAGAIRRRSAPSPSARSARAGAGLHL